MSADYKPGTVAVATVRGVEGVRVMRVRNLDGWVDENGYAHTPEGHGLDTRTPVTDVHPLVVLDIPVEAYRIIGHLRTCQDCRVREGWCRDLADQIEAQTKPPRIPEPSEPLAEVTASTVNRERRRFVRGMNAGETKGRWVDGVASWSWSELIDPAPVGGTP